MINKILKGIEKESSSVRQPNMGMEISLQDFIKGIKAEAELFMKANNSANREYVVTEDVLEVIKILWEYSKQKHPSKGIALVGKIGCGKSLLMMAFIRFHKRYTELAGRHKTSTYKYYNSINLVRDIPLLNRVEYNNLVSSPLLIDEMGRETKEVVTFGTRSTPIIDFMMNRYERNTTTLMTSNMKLDTLSNSEMYGNVIGDRLKEMLHFVEMKGESKRF